jgi:hypothetical protein
MKKLEKVFAVSIGFMIIGACIIDFYGISFLSSLFIIGGGICAIYSGVFGSINK